MQVNVGQTYKDSLGTSWYIEHRIRRPGASRYVYLGVSDIGHISRFAYEGTSLVADATNDPRYNLLPPIPKWNKYYAWMNIYRGAHNNNVPFLNVDVTNVLFNTQAEAIANAIPSLRLVATVRVKWKEPNSLVQEAK